MIIDDPNFHFIWKDINKNDKTFKQRYRVKNAEDQFDVLFPRRIFGHATYQSALLKERLTNGFYYNDIFYDNTGERIQLSPKQHQEAIKLFTTPSVFKYSEHSDYKKASKAKRKQFLKLFPIIEEKDRLLLKEIERRTKQIEKINNDLPAKILYLKKLSSQINSTAYYLKIKQICDAIKFILIPNIDFNVVVERNNKETELKFSDFYKAILNKTTYTSHQNPLILDFQIVGVDDFGLDKFVKARPNLGYDSIYKKIRKKLN